MAMEVGVASVVGYVVRDPNFQSSHSTFGVPYSMTITDMSSYSGTGAV
jgi:hypothetical protein